MYSPGGKIKVIHFQRKARPGFNYSIESIFKNLRCQLKNNVAFSVKTSSFYNNGYLSKFLNIIEAAFKQKKNVVSHVTGEVHFLNLLMRKKNVLLTIHDCRFMERKKGVEKVVMQWLYLKLPVKKSTYITAVSENTKKDVVRYTGCNPGKIYVIPNAPDALYQPALKSFNTAKPLILQVGTGPNKNILRLAEALKNIPCTLNIIGKLSSEQVETLNNCKIDYTNHYHLSEAEMLKQYQSCDMLAFVSTFEGFGMPIIEANGVERAVITSNISSMPEIAGDAACLVDPYSIADIRNGILKLVHDADYRERLITNGRQNKLRFNGEIIADQYYTLYKKIANHI